MTKSLLKIKVGDDDFKHTIVGDRIVFAKLFVDHDIENPMDNYGNGKLVSFSKNHENFIGDDVTERQVNFMIMHDEAIALSYFEHSQCRWMVASEPTPPGVEFQWDGVKFAGLWIPDAEVWANIEFDGPVTGDERRAKLIEYANGVCEQFSMYCNGEGYGYYIEVYAVREDEAGKPYTDPRDYARPDKIAEDSCSGFLGYTYAMESAIEAANDLLEEQNASLIDNHVISKEGV